MGERIKQLREEKEISQKDLALFLGVSPSTVGMYEQGRRTPDSEMIIKLTDYFEVSADYLLGKSNIKTINKPYKDNTECKTIPVNINGTEVQLTKTDINNVFEKLSNIGFDVEKLL